jgi:muramoyltetrapeptide carboxypeptidase
MTFNQFQVILCFGFCFLGSSCNQDLEYNAFSRRQIDLKKIAVLAPSSPLENLVPYQKGLEIIKQHGGEIIYDGPSQRPYEFPYLNGSDEERLNELRHVLFSGQYDVAWLERGGYGLTRILPLLEMPIDLLRAPPVVIGFSDGSALLLHLWATAKIKSVHNSSVNWLERLPPDCLEALWMVLGCRAKEVVYPPLEVQFIPLHTNHIEGISIVMNLTLINSLIGTKSMPRLDGTILVLEDVGESPYRIDRMLTHLWATGVFDGVKAVVMGEFTDAGVDPNLIKKIFVSRFSTLGIPVFSGMRVGHIADNWAVPIGVKAQIEFTPNNQNASFKILEEICSSESSFGELVNSDL